MKPVKQKYNRYPDGDCFSACVASILEVPLKEVPRMKLGLSMPLAPIYKWLQRQDLYVAYLPYPNRFKNYYISVYKNRSGDGTHAVVSYRGNVVHDPAPVKDKYTKKPLWCCCILRLNDE